MHIAMAGIWIAAGSAAVLAAILALLAALAARFALARERRLAALAGELEERLQASRSAPEARRLLVEHATRVVDGAGVALLAAGGEDGRRLVPTLHEGVERTPLQTIRTEGLPARGCLALRLQRGHRRRGGDASVARCEVCGWVDGDVICEPLRGADGSVGSLLVASPARISGRQRAALGAAIRRATPLLAARPDPDVDGAHALVDPLTALPNARAADEALRRMAAHAGRAISPLAAVLVALDHFAAIAEIQGPDRCERVLAEVGRLLPGAARASDFVARRGDAEFILLLPDTGREGALELAEKVRRGIERAGLAELHPVTASLGVAALPDDALDPGRLLAEAQRALEGAKALGGNRVQAAPRQVPGGK